jgi:hypothetical protein
MTVPTTRTTRPTFDTATMSNTDIVLVILNDLGGRDRAVDIEDIAEAAWQAVPARFSWPRHQQYPDLDAVDVTLRAAKKNDDLVSGSKKDGWMLTPPGLRRVEQRDAAVRGFIAQFGNAGRMDNRRERGGLDSASVRRLEQLRTSGAAEKHRDGRDAEISVYDFMAFFAINQYMPDRKYVTNRQAVENLVRNNPELLETVGLLHDRFGQSYKALLQQAKDGNHGIA